MKRGTTTVDAADYAFVALVKEFMKRLLLGLAAIALFLLTGAAPARADAIVFSSLGPGDSFASGTLAITGPSGPGSEPDRDLGSSFVAPGGGRLYAIDLPLSWSEGVNAGDVWFMSDLNGRPGDILESWHLTDLPRLLDMFLTGELVTVTSILRPKLKKDTQYWVAASADDDTLLSWFVNDTGYIGVAFRHGDGPWGFNDAADVDSLAFRIHKNPSGVPEPSAFLLLGTGVLGLVLAARRRRASGQS